jgi:hypothetical protein
MLGATNFMKGKDGMEFESNYSRKVREIRIELSFS